MRTFRLSQPGNPSFSPVTTTSPNFGSLGAGTYTILILTDSYSCSEFTSATLGVHGLTGSAIAVTPSCSNFPSGTVTLGASNGIGPYFFRLSPPYGDGTWTSSPDFTGLRAGPTSFDVTDSSDDKQTATLIVDVPTAPGVVVAPNIVNSTIPSTNVGNGAVVLHVVSGQSPFLFSRANLGVDIEAEATSSNAFENLPRGLHPFAIIDGRQCRTTVQVLVGAQSSSTVFFNHFLICY